MNTYSFEKLDVWQNSRIMVKDVYLVSKSFPKEEQFGLTSQLRRAGISISCNIAEGVSRWSGKEKIRFIEIAYGSLMEVLNCLILAMDLEYMNYDQLEFLRLKIDVIAGQLNGLKKHFDTKS